MKYHQVRANVNVIASTINAFCEGRPYRFVSLISTGHPDEKILLFREEYLRSRFQPEQPSVDKKKGTKK